MSINIYDIYRNKNDKRKECYDNRSAAFILDGKISQDIFHKRINKTIKAALVFDNKEGPDEVTVFTLKENNLLKSDYFVYEDVNFLVFEDVRLTDKSVNYKKQLAVECNVAFTFNSKEYYGYYMSRLRRTNDPSFAKQEGVIPDESPLLILPSSSEITIGDKFMIEGKPWKVVENDNITNKGITYYYLERGFIKREEEIEESESEMESFAAEESPQEILKVLKEYTFETEGAFFSSTPRVDLIARTREEITFKIPFGIEEVSISTRKDGQIVEKNYKVVR